MTAGTSGLDSQTFPHLQLISKGTCAILSSTSEPLPPDPAFAGLSKDGGGGESPHFLTAAGDIMRRCLWLVSAGMGDPGMGAPASVDDTVEVLCMELDFRVAWGCTGGLRCWLHQKSPLALRPERRCRPNAPSAPFQQSEKACTSVVESVLSPAIVHSSCNLSLQDRWVLCEHLAVPTAVPLRDSWTLQDTGRSAVMFPIHRFGPRHWKMLPRMGSTAAVWWPCGDTCVLSPPHAALLSLHTHLEGPWNLRPGCQKPTPCGGSRQAGRVEGTDCGRRSLSGHFGLSSVGGVAAYSGRVRTSGGT